MAESVEQILARAKGNTVTLPKPKPLEIKNNGPGKVLDYVDNENKSFRKSKAQKKATLKMIDLIFPIDSKAVGGLVSDREFVLLFAEIVGYDYERCKKIFTNATLMHEMLDITYPKLLIYKGIINGKMGI